MTAVLLFTRTTGYRHGEAIEAGIEMIQFAARKRGVEVVVTEDPDVYQATRLRAFNATVWLHVSGNVLESTQRTALADFLARGGGFAGIHGAADAEREWPEYEQIVGARFLYHPNDGAQVADLIVEGPEHPSTTALPNPWSWTEEWYSFERSPRPEVDVLLAVDESTYDHTYDPTVFPRDALKMGDDHPISWAGRFGEGRTWFTALGHHVDAYANPLFIEHVWGGISSVL